MRHCLIQETVGIAEENLVRLGKGLVILGFGCEHLLQCLIGYLVISFS